MVVLSIISRLQKKMTAFICRYQILNQISDLTGNSSGQKIKFQNQMEIEQCVRTFKRVRMNLTISNPVQKT